MTPTLPTACGSLPPEGALRLRPGEAGSAAPAGGCGRKSSPYVGGRCSNARQFLFFPCYAPLARRHWRTHHE